MLANPNKLLTVILLTTAVAIVGYTGTRGQSPQAPQNVLVANSTTQAVPVKNGSTPFNVTVANTIGQALPVKQSGSWYVGLSGVPNIHVANSSSQPVPTTNRDEEGRHCFNYPIESFIGTNAYSAQVALPAVPSGQRLIITHLDAFCQALDGDLDPGEIFLTINPPTNIYDRFFFALNSIQNEPTISIGSLDCFIQANAGDSGSVFIQRPSASSANSSLYFHVDVQGYFVSLP